MKVNSCQRVKGNSINSGSCHAERYTTLSEIDSAWQNKEIMKNDAIRLALNLNIGFNASQLAAILSDK